MPPSTLNRASSIPTPHYFKLMKNVAQSDRVGIIIQEVDRFTYKPGHTFRTHQRYGGIDVILDARVSNSSDPCKQVNVQIYRHLDAWLINSLDPVRVALNTVLAIVAEFELHESHEWLKYQTRHVNNPHPEL